MPAAAEGDRLTVAPGHRVDAWVKCIPSETFYHRPPRSAPLARYRSSRNPGSGFGRSSAFAAYHPVRYIHRAIRSSFG
jgi:hypothetical protein